MTVKTLLCDLISIYVVVLFRLSPFYRVIADLDLQALTMKASRVGMASLFATALCWVVSAYDAFLVARYTRRG